MFTGQVLAISSFNACGLFNILDKHAPFIMSMYKKLTLTLPSQEEKTINTGCGVIHVSDQEVKIYIGL